MRHLSCLGFGLVLIAVGCVHSSGEEAGPMAVAKGFDGWEDGSLAKACEVKAFHIEDGVEVATSESVARFATLRLEYRAIEKDFEGIEPLRVKWHLAQPENGGSALVPHDGFLAPTISLAAVGEYRVEVEAHLTASDVLSCERVVNVIP